ncbi:MAG TPA: hypothetical protein VNA15_10725, partial [Candidatus Angelobacter sp.]|nr:hypothetical protein [Candidatus Angelobacter sp.]
KLQGQRKEVYTEYHDCILNSSDFRHYVANNSVLIYRANEVAQYDGIDDYLIAPITSYDLNVDDKAPKEICLGTFGFGYRSKRIEEVIRLARKLNLKAKIVTSVNTESLKDQTETEITRLRKLSTERIEVISGVTMDGGDGEKTIIEVLSECSHFIFAHMNSLGASGTMTFVKCFHRPIVALDSFQAVQAQVIRVPMLASRASPVGYQTLEFVMGLFVRRRSIRSLLLRILKLVHAKPVTREYLNHFARQPKIGLRTFLREISRVMRARPVTRQYLDDLAQRQITSRDDDGFDYLLNILDFGKA